MAVNPRAGQPAAATDLVDVAHLVTAYYTEHPDPADARAAGRLRHLRPPRLAAWTGVQRGPHRRDHPGDLRVPRGAGHRRPAVPRPRHPRAVRAGLTTARSRCSPPTTSPCWIDSRDGYTPTPAVSHAILTYNRGRDGRPRRRHRRHAVAQPAARTAASSTTRRTADRPTPTPPAGSRTAPTSCCAPASRACAGSRSRGRRGRHDAAVRLPRRLRRRPAARPRPRRDPRRRRADRRRPARRRERRLLGRDRRAARARPHRGQPAGRPDVAVHDAGLGRQDPDGLLLAVRDGLADRQAPRVRDRHRQRRRRRPARHRHPRRRADEPQPLPRGRDRLPVRPPAGLACGAPPSARRWSRRR